jgi:hypothetical protein
MARLFAYMLDMKEPREQLTPISQCPTRCSKNGFPVGTFRAKEKITAKPQQVVDWTFAERTRR